MTPRPRSAQRSDAKRAMLRCSARCERVKEMLKVARAQRDDAKVDVAKSPSAERQRRLTRWERRVDALESQERKAASRYADATLKHHGLLGAAS